MNTKTTDPTLLLSDQERGRLEELEGVVRRGLATYVQVGMALKEIHDSRLYRDRHLTFADYCVKVWRMSRQHATRLIAASEVAVGLAPVGDNVPVNERQARATPSTLQDLAKRTVEGMTPDEREAAVERANEIVAQRQASGDTRPAKTVGGDGREERLKLGERTIAKAIKVYEGLGGSDGEAVIVKLREASELSEQIPTMAPAKAA